MGAVAGDPPHSQAQQLAEDSRGRVERAERPAVNQHRPELETLQEETSAWAAEWNQQDAKINGQVTTDDARIKLQHLYPTLRNCQGT